jgi:hypothetical protein
VTRVSEETKKRAAHLVCELGPYKAVDMISHAISHLDVSRTARQHGDIGSAEGALACVRELLLDVLGIDRKQYYWCLRCKQPTATKQPDAQGWDGSCRNCGMVAQSQVGEPV